MQLGTQVDATAPLGVLRGVVEQVQEHLHQTSQIGVHDHGAGRQRHRQFVAHFLDQRAARLDGPLHDVRQFDLLPLEFDPVLFDAADVHQVVDQPDHRLRLPFDDLRRPVQLRDVRAFYAQNLNGVPHRGQRVAQFVSQRRQKLVLAVVNVA